MNKKLKNRKKTRSRKGGSLGLDQLGYGWNGSNVNTWPGVEGNPSAITRSNHLRVSPNGVPVGGPTLPYSTYGDATGNSSNPVSPCKYKYLGGKKKKTRGKKSVKKCKSIKSGGWRYITPKGPKSSSKKKRGGSGLFFNDIRNFGRYLANGVKTRVNGARGIPAPDGVMPTDQPYLDRDVKVIISDPVDVETIYKTNSKNVSKI